MDAPIWPGRRKPRLFVLQGITAPNRPRRVGAVVTRARPVRHSHKSNARVPGRPTVTVRQCGPSESAQHARGSLAPTRGRSGEACLGRPCPRAEMAVEAQPQRRSGWRCDAGAAEEMGRAGARGFDRDLSSMVRLLKYGRKSGVTCDYRSPHRAAMSYLLPCLPRRVSPNYAASLGMPILLSGDAKWSHIHIDTTIRK